VCYFFLAISILAGKAAFCQGAYIPPGASVCFFAKDSAAVFGTVQVDGYLGQDSAHFLYFRGTNWKNAATAAFNDKGIIAFNPTLPNTTQQLTGAYNATAHTGIRMPVLLLNNAAGLSLDNTSDLSIQELRFTRGVLSLNGSSLVIRNGQAANPISGYHQDAFVATGQDPMGGFVEIQNLAAAGKTYVWPLGTTAASYTPFSFVNNGAAGAIKARVFNNVYDGGLSGALLNSRSTGTTFMLNSTMNLTGRLRMQHATAQEGASYVANRDKAGVARLNETTNTWNNPETTATPVSPGTITSAAPVTGTATTFADVAAVPAGTSLFASLVSEVETTCQQQLASLTAERLSTLRVKLDWTLQGLTNLRQMVIEKDVYNNGQWLVLDSLVPGTGTVYTYTDTTAYSNTTSAYRIRLDCNIGGFVYADRVLVAPPEKAGDPVLMYPNPATVVVNVAIPDYQHYVWLMVYDLTGHMLIRQRITGAVSKVDVSALPGGSYNVFLITPDNKVTGNLRIIKVN
jgi:hypothetical protein